MTRRLGTPRTAAWNERLVHISLRAATETPLRVLVIEPHEIERRGLHDMLSSLDFVSSAESLDSVKEAKEVSELSSTDAVLVSSDVKPGDLESLLPSFPAATRVLVLIRNRDTAALAAAAQLPAHGFIFETDLDAATLGEALIQLREKLSLMPAELAEHLLSAARQAGRSTGPALTPREREVLRLLTRGLSNKAIARELGISDHGAKRHVANVLAKLNAPNRTSAVARALNENLL